VVRLHRLGPAQQKKEIPSSKKITTQKIPKRNFRQTKLLTTFDKKK
jgi:hypothetical protein